MRNQLGTVIITAVFLTTTWLSPVSAQAQVSSGPSAEPAAQTAADTGTLTNSRVREPDASTPVETQDAQPRLFPGSKAPASLLGMTLAQVAVDFGAPVQVFPVRGGEAWQDDVVYYYPDHSYLFWFRDRVWQVRVDRRFAGEVLGLKMGESRARVEQVLGSPLHESAQSEIFILPDRGFPVRARLFFTDGTLSDLYVYRGDF